MKPKQRPAFETPQTLNSKPEGLGVDLRGLAAFHAGVPEHANDRHPELVRRRDCPARERQLNLTGVETPPSVRRSRPRLVRARPNVCTGHEVYAYTFAIPEHANDRHPELIRRGNCPVWERKLNLPDSHRRM